MEKKIGILIPVYNSEKYIERCLKSVINQTYKNLEVMIIDDGSKDNSLEICKKTINNDKRFKIYTRENKGVAFTRNELIAKSTSEYLVFIDSDDFINLEYIEVMSNLTQKYDADMVISQINLYNKCKKETNSLKNNVITSKEALKKLFYSHEITHGPTCKMFKKKLFKNIKFPNGKIYEDLGTMYKIIEECENIVLTEYKGYNYIYNHKGITKGGFKKTEVSMLEYGEEIFEYITKKYGEELLLPVKNLLVEQSIELACKIPLNKQYENEIKRIKKYIKQYRAELLKSKETYPRIKIYLIASIFGLKGIKLCHIIKHENSFNSTIVFFLQ